MLTQTPSAVNPLLDPMWIVAIQEEIDAQPETLSDVVEPELMGRFDAEMGKPCEPTQHYIKLGEIEAYIIGWKDATALLHETLEYEDDIADREWHSRGMW